MPHNDPSPEAGVDVLPQSLDSELFRVHRLRHSSICVWVTIVFQLRLRIHAKLQRHGPHGLVPRSAHPNFASVRRSCSIGLCLNVLLQHKLFPSFGAALAFAFAIIINQLQCKLD